jgi:hypothetical protein
MEVSGQFHAPASLPQGNTPPPVPSRCWLDRRLGEPQSLSGRDGEEKSPCICRESNPHRHYTDWATTAPAPGRYRAEKFDKRCVMWLNTSINICVYFMQLCSVK